MLKVEKSTPVINPDGVACAGTHSPKSSRQGILFNIALGLRNLKLGPYAVLSQSGASTSCKSALYTLCYVRETCKFFHHKQYQSETVSPSQHLQVWIWKILITAVLGRAYFALEFSSQLPRPPSSFGTCSTSWLKRNSQRKPRFPIKILIIWYPRSPVMIPTVGSPGPPTMIPMF